MSEFFDDDSEIKDPAVSAGNEPYPMIVIRDIVIFPGYTYTVEASREKSLLAVNRALDTGRDVFVVTQKHRTTLNPGPKDIYRIGTLARVKQLLKSSSDSVRVVLESKVRMEIESFVAVQPSFEVVLRPCKDTDDDPQMLKAVRRNIINELKEYRETESKVMLELQVTLSMEDDERFVAAAAPMFVQECKQKQELLSLRSVCKRLEFLYEKIVEEVSIKDLERQISVRAHSNIEKNQRDYFLREKVRVIQEELGDDESECEELLEQVEKKKLPKEVREKVIKEISRLDKMSVTAPEANIVRSYVELILAMPWKEKTTDNTDLKKAEKILDEDHYGLQKVKERILEHLAVHTLTDSAKSVILCLVGPPGVGKTSVVASMARALDRKFISMALGGVRDEAEIRGHRRTYVGAMPGRIISGIKNAGVMNPVFLLDEIDKMSSDHRGDPASAMLEVLDPNQNFGFTDNYLDMPYDLSKVMFVTTANTVESIPAPLLDRMEIIPLSGYSLEEKIEIAKRYLLPKQLKANGLEKVEVIVSDAAVDETIRRYTRESGVRGLEREIAAIARKLAVKLVNAGVGNIKSFTVDRADIEGYLGAPKYKDGTIGDRDEVGYATGLAWTSAGGDTLGIEVSLVSGGKGEVRTTGSLGDVMKESCFAALTAIRSKAEEYGIAPEKFKDYDLHIHVPEGAIPKDGPSAGITIATAILSAMSGRKVKRSVAMTGEITLRGRVLAIGGLKEKTLAAYRSGIRTVIIPSENLKDIADLPKEVKDNIEIVCVERVEEVFSLALSAVV